PLCPYASLFRSTRDLERVDDLVRCWGGESHFCPAAEKMLTVEPGHVVADHEVGGVENVPYGAHESVVPADFPFGGEVDSVLAVPSPCCADGAGPFGYVVGVDASTDGVLPPVEVPEVAGDGEAAMLNGRTSGDALDIEGDDASLNVRGDAGLNVL